MTDTPNPTSPQPSRPRSMGTLLKLALLLALAAGGWLLFQYFQSLAQQRDQFKTALDDLQTRTAQIQQQQSGVLDTARQSALAIANFDNRLEGYDQAVGKLTEELQGGRVRFQLAAVENLLLAANERVQLQHDARGGIAALELADERLASLAEPRLFKLREAIAQERAALAAVPQPDRTSAALTLASLIGRVPQLPLRARVPDHIEATHEQLSAPPDAGWAQRAWISALQALQSVFSVRRNEGPAPRLLAPDQEALVYQILALKLEGARVAMLSQDGESFRTLCDSSMGWLNDYFRADDPNVVAARAELERLQSLRLDAPLPDITRSLTLLRGYLDAPAQ